MNGLIHTHSSEPKWVVYIKQRIKNNKNFMCFIGGPTGSGKSTSSLRIAQLLDPNFSQDRIVFTPLEFMQLLNGGTLSKGSVIVFEEAGVTMNNRNWQSTVNKMMNFVAQTFRHRNYIVIFNSPHMDFVDSATRKLFHAKFETLSIDKKKKQVVLKPLLLQYNADMRKTYMKYLQFTSPGRTATKLERWRIDLPTPDLLEAYELKKTAFTDKLNNDLMRELENVQSKEQEKLQGSTKPLTDNQQSVLELLDRGMSIKEIAKVRDVALASVYNMIQGMKKKGYVVKPIKNPGSNLVVSYSVTKEPNRSY